MIIEVISQALAAGPWETFENGDFLGGITQVFTDVLPGGLFFAILLMIPVAMLYIRTQSAGPPLMILLLGSAVMASVFPAPVRQLMTIIAALSVAGIIFYLFWGGGGQPR